MITVLQLAGLFTVFGAVLVLALSVVTHRLQPTPFFRSWVISYAWALPLCTCTAAFTFFGPQWWIMAVMTFSSSMVCWWQLHMAAGLRNRPYPGVRTALGLSALFLVGQVLWFNGAGFDVSVTPGALTLLGVHLWLGRAMLQAGRTPQYKGLSWLGWPIILHGAWLLTYPVAVGSSVHWLMHSIDTWLGISVGIGMAMYVMLRTNHLLEVQNQHLATAQSELSAAQAERDRLQKQEILQLQEADRLKQEFLNVASHELRTPLTAITGYAEFLEDSPADSLGPEQREYVIQIRKGAERLRAITSDMLDLARAEAGSFKLALARTDLGQLLRDEVASLRPEAQLRGVTLSVEAEAPIEAMLDFQRVSQVVLNLAANALEFTPVGGSVRLVASDRGDRARVDVIDTGIGIPAVNLPHLFEKFYQVQSGHTRSHGGTGLGLAICRTLVEAHGGHIDVESEPGRGSTFWFELPKNGPPTAAAVEPADSRPT